MDELLRAFEASRTESDFLALYRRDTPMLYALSLRLTGSREEAEELVQVVWIRAIERLGRFERRSTLRTWLTGILLNCHRERSRRAPRETGYDDDVDAAPPVARFDGYRRFDPLDVERAVARLPEGYREVLVLHDVNGYTHEEIAGLLGIDAGTSKSQLARGRRRLRELLEGTVAREMGRGRQ